MIHPDTKDSFNPKAAPFCKTVAEHGETFEEYVSQPAHFETTKKVIDGILPWVNVSTLPYNGWPSYFTNLFRE